MIFRDISVIEYLDVPLPGGRDAPRNTRVASCGAGERPGPTPLLKITTITSMFSNIEKKISFFRRDLLVCGSIFGI